MKKIRLDLGLYAQECHPCHITICSFGGQCIFANHLFTNYCMALLESYCERFNLFLHVYCFMPDHLYFIVSVRGDKSIISLVQAFKSKTTIDSRKYGNVDRIYQSRFYDHFPRTMRDLEIEIQYILENPIRRGLAKEVGEYPYCKCFI